MEGMMKSSQELWLFKKGIQLDWTSKNLCRLGTLTIVCMTFRRLLINLEPFGTGLTMIRFEKIATISLSIWSDIFARRRSTTCQVMWIGSQSWDQFLGCGSPRYRTSLAILLSMMRTKKKKVNHLSKLTTNSNRIRLSTKEGLRMNYSLQLCMRPKFRLQVH